MKINEIKQGMNNISLKAKVIAISETRDVQTRYGRRSVADALLEDETGQISLTLWEDRINSVAVGDTVDLAGAFVTSFRNKLQLNIPRSGRLEIVKE